MEDKHKVIEKILIEEWRMFISVNQGKNQALSGKEHPTCRDFPDEFRLHRESKLLPWSYNTLESYLNDIETAQKRGRNLMTYKYARMDDLIPSENKSPLIDTIAGSLVLWQKEFIKKYPGIMSGGRSLSGGQPGVDWPSFENYLRCELETYSEKTLEFLKKDIDSLRTKGKSMSDLIYSHLVKAKGYLSLEEAEMKKK